ncbi:MAG: DUF2089 domain-containing protein [Chloroflexi bacterium]|nr:DUF2089 domain-containing protein [Chloroflexota bacterium]
MSKIPEKCPLCGGSLTVSVFQCQRCGTEFHGHFSLAQRGSAFDRLNAEQLRFLEVFIRNEGKFSRMEKEMGLSYPTLRNRLREIIQAMGYQPAAEDAGPRKPSPQERQQILDDLEAGKLTAAEAARLLRGESLDDRA